MHLYVHVPFCARRCSYCDFAIAVRREVPAAAFVDAILAEWRGVAGVAGRGGAPIETIYFGGGTPSLVGAAALGRIVAAVRAETPVAATAEITVEANPEDVTPDLAAGLVAAGVTRVSLGVQSFDPGVLTWMHRIHGPEQPGVAVQALRNAGIDNISIDLIYGVPASFRRDWDADLDRALALEPRHLSLYGLTVEPGTPLARWIGRGAVAPAGDDAAGAEYLRANARLGAAGFRHYEVSNAARPGFESRHNQAYWRRASYLGLGPSSHSADGTRRWWNIREWEPYRAAVEAGAPLVAGEETLGPDQVALEAVYLGLRTDSGIAASSLPQQEVREWIAAGWADLIGSHLVLTPEGWLRLDALVGRVGAA